MENSIKLYRHREPYEYISAGITVSGMHETLFFKVPAKIYTDPNALQQLKKQKEERFGRQMKYVVTNEEDTSHFLTEGDLGLHDSAAQVIKTIHEHSWDDWDLFYVQGI